jgi:hypothetical protein
MARFNREEAELDDGEAERRRQLDSSTRHRRRLQRRPNSFGTRRLRLAAIGQFREGEEESEAGEWCYGGVLFYGIEGALL